MPGGTGSGKSSKKSGKGSKKSGKLSGRDSASKQAAKEAEEKRLAEEKAAAAEAAKNAKKLLKEKLRKAKEKTEELARLKPVQYEETMEEMKCLFDHEADAFAKEKYDFEYERFRRSGKRPDAIDAKSLNTFMSLVKDKGSSEVKSVLKEVNLMLSLIDEAVLINEKYSAGVGAREMELRKSKISELRDMIQERYNQATLRLLENATFDADSDADLYSVSRGNNELLMVWGNLTKNPRATQFQFPDGLFTMGMPKTIAVADVGVQILVTWFDHLSDHCSTFYPKKPPQPVVEEPVPPAEGEGGEKSSGSLEKSGEKEEGSDEKDGSDEQDGSDEKDEEVEEKGSSEEGSGEKEGSGEGEDEEEEKESEIQEEPTPDPVTPIASAPVEVAEEEVVEEVLDPDVVDLRQFSRLGQVYDIKLVHMPPQPLFCEGWILTELEDKPLTPLVYPDDVTEPPKPPPTPSGSDAEEDDEEEEGEKEEKTKPEPVVEPTPLLPITINTPEKVLFYEEPTLARWDPQDCHWKTSGLSEVVYNDEEKTVTFKTDDFGKFCFFQDTHLNMPFQSWELVPTGDDSALFTVIAACSENIFEIKDTKVRLLKPEEGVQDEFGHLYEEWMSGEELVEAMKAAGNNIFPSCDSVNYVSVGEKELDCNPIYDQMAYLSASFAFAWSKFGNEVRETEYIFQVIPVLKPTSEMKSSIGENERAATYMQTPDRCYKLALKEQDDKIAYEIAQGCDYQCDLYHAIANNPIPDEKEGAETKKELLARLRTANMRVASTIKYLLRQTNVLTFS